MLNVLPSLAAGYQVNIGTGDIEQLSNLLALGAVRNHRFNCRYVCFGQLVEVIARTMIAALFGATIRYVLCWSASKEMFGIDTRRVVALVADNKSVWNRSVMNLEREPVSINCPVSSEKQQTVTSSLALAGP